MISILVLSAVLAQNGFCPPDNVPSTCGGKQSRGGTSVGDPVDFGQGNPTGYVTRTDFAVQTGLGRVEFKRTFATRWTPSELPPVTGFYTNTFYSGVAKPFGGLPSDSGMYWWHSWMAMVENDSSQTFVRTQSGRYIAFGMTPLDCGDEYVLALEGRQVRETARLTCSGSDTKRSYSFTDEDGRQLIFGYKSSWVTSTIRRSVLTEIRRDGRIEVQFSYATPLDVGGGELTSCTGSYGTGAPFIRWATIPSMNRRLEFRYAVVAGSCPIKELRLIETFGTNSAVVASYEYATANGAAELRTVSSAYALQPALGFQWGAGDFETYCGYGGDFRVLAGLWPTCGVGQGGEPLNRFVVDANKFVTQASTPSEAFTIAYQHPTVTTTWTRSSGRNEPLSTPLTVSQYSTLAGTSNYHSAYVSATEFSCSPLLSCRNTAVSPPEERTGETGTTDAGSSDVSGHRLGGTYSWVGHTQTSQLVLPGLIQTGGTSAPANGQCTPGWPCTKVGWTLANVEPKPSSERRPSVLVVSGEAETQSWYHPNGLLSKRVETGWTRNLAGTIVPKAFATFYRLQPVCAGAVAYAERIVEVEGPCEIDPAATQTATQCAGPVRPVIHYTYYGTGSGADVGRLATIRRYPGGCGSAPVLVTTLAAYLESGYPLYSWDENGQQRVELRDTEGRLLYEWAGGGTSYFFYENGKLIRSINPSGLTTISCYRDSTLKPSTPAYVGVRCDGPWTGRLEWVAKTDGDAHSTSTNFFEAVEFAYGAGRTLRTRTYVKRTEGVRRVEVVDEDARGNLTFAGTGSVASPVADVARFDSANLPVARGAAFNRPSPLCGLSAAPEPNCTTLGYDSAGRAISALIPLSSTISEADGIAYDTQGNVCDISLGGTAQCNSGASGGQTRLGYEHDDFGNLVRAYLPGTADIGYSPSGTKGAHMREYSVGGRLVQAKTPEMVAQLETQTFSYDALGRLLATSVVLADGGVTPVNTFVYDSPTYLPCDGQPQMNVVGRLAREYDPSGATYYSYDALGRVTNESRLWNNAGSRCSAVRYVYRADGQVERIAYPSGLEVRYLFDWTHRVSGVEIWQGTPLAGPWTAVWNASWEPFGGISEYYSQGVWLSYQLGQTQATWSGGSWQAPPNGLGCPTTASTIPDGTGLPSKLVARNPSSGSALLVEEYSWAADQLLKAKRCYNGNNGGSPALETTYQYDTARRLTQAESAAGGGLGPIGREVWNRTPTAALNERGVATLAFKYGFGVSAGRTSVASPNDVAWIYQNLVRAKPKHRSYTFDRDGRMGREYYSGYPGPRPATGCGDSGDVCGSNAPCCAPFWCQQTAPPDPSGFCRPNQPAQFGNSREDTWSKFAPGSLNTMATEVSKFERNAQVVWQYAFDSQNRRRLKASPTQRRSFFTYSLSKQLLEEAREGATAGAPDTIEEYIYLGGQPVVISRALFNRSTGQRDSSSPNCGEMQHDVGQVSCAWRYPVFDPVVGKAVAIIDSSQRVVWTGEYQPMGARNRQEYWGGVYDPTGGVNWPGYDAIQARDQDIAVPTQLRAGMDMKIRVRFALFDMRLGQDSVRIRNSFNQEVWVGSGYELGALRTPWLPMTTDVFGVKFVSSASDTQSPHWYAGAHMEGYEWTRFAPGSEAYGTPLGFVGMYYDEETEKYENWNREYDPFVGNYLSPEPMLEEPNWAKVELQAGRSVVAYGYGSGNPITNSDPTGLYTIQGNCGSTLPGLGREKAAIEAKARAFAQQIQDGDPLTCKPERQGLRQCVLSLIDSITVRCNAASQAVCDADRLRPVASTPVGTCSANGGPIDWCRLGRANQDCIAKVLVHETAHACGWMESQGLNVPFNSGVINCVL